MFPPNLDTLPIELLHKICTFVSDPGSKHATVLSLSLTCKYCRRAVGALLFRNLRIQIHSTQHLPGIVSDFFSALQAVNGFGFVRRLHITAEILNNTGQQQSFEPDDKDDAEHRQHEDEGKDERKGEPLWTSLARFIESLSRLQDLIYESSVQQFPPTLLHAVHKSACRLHLYRFHLQSLLRKSTCDMSDLVLLEPHEMELIASPNLYAIQRQRGSFALKSPGHYDYDRYDYNDDAIKQLVPLIRGLQEFTCLPASRKKHNVSSQDDPFKEQHRSRSRPSWPGLSLESPLFENPRKKAELTSLTVGHVVRSAFQLSGHDFQWRMLEAWSQKIDFSKLQTLSLVNATDTNALSWLTSKASDMMLRSIKLEGAPNATPELNALLNALSPLETLDLLGEFGSSIPNAIFEQHGSTLRRLSLPGHGAIEVFPSYRHYAGCVCSPREVRDLRIYCPLLEELAISITRSRGDEQELKVYSELGSHPGLQHIHLVLECAIDVRTASNFEDTFDQEAFEWPRRGKTETCNGHVLQALENCAIDRQLVASIFRQIAAAKPEKSLPLQLLDVQVSNAGKFIDNVRPPRTKATAGRIPRDPYDKHMYLREPIFRHFTKKWVATPNQSIDCVGGVMVEKSRDNRFLAEGPWWTVLNYHDIDGEEEPLDLGSVERHFRLLWPEGATGDPRDEWHSFPLGK